MPNPAVIAPYSALTAYENFFFSNYRILSSTLPPPEEDEEVEVPGGSSLYRTLEERYLNQTRRNAVDLFPFHIILLELNALSCRLFAGGRQKIEFFTYIKVFPPPKMVI